MRENHTEHDHFYRKQSVKDKFETCLHCGKSREQTGEIKAKSKAIKKKASDLFD